MTCYAHWPDIRAKPMARDKQKDTPTSDAANLPPTGRPKGTWPEPCNLHSFGADDRRGDRSTAEIATAKLRR
jgi:hypothetical protein